MLIKWKRQVHKETRKNEGIGWKGERTCKFKYKSLFDRVLYELINYSEKITISSWVYEK